MLNETIRVLSREQLLSLLESDAKNWLATDGYWFQSIERKYGMDEAMFHDIEMWRGFAVTEARRLRKFLALPEHPGLDGLALALELRLHSRCSPSALERTADGRLRFRYLRCRVQDARSGKGMPLHPCRVVGEIEFAAFARTIDDRIRCRCLSCYPEITDDSCACAWEFSIPAAE